MCGRVPVKLHRLSHHETVLQVYNNGMSDINKVDFTVDSELAWREDADLGKVLTKWYSDFVSKRLTTPGLCYSLNRYPPINYSLIIYLFTQIPISFSFLFL